MNNNLPMGFILFDELDDPKFDTWMVSKAMPYATADRPRWLPGCSAGRDPRHTALSGWMAGERLAGRGHDSTRMFEFLDECYPLAGAWGTITVCKDIP